MKSIRILLVAFLCAPTVAFAQFAVNPQLGVSFQNLSNTPDGLESKANVGFLLGADFRIGERFYFQPGAFFERTATTITAGDSAVVEDDLVRSYVKLKGHVGYNIVDGDAFRFRANAGVSYDLLLSVDSKDDKIEFNKDDFNSGLWNANAGLGVDFTMFTIETGASYGLSDIFKEGESFEEDVKHFTWYLTLGVVLGGATE